MSEQQSNLIWLAPGAGFPDTENAWSKHSQAPGLLAAGGALDTTTLLQAYANGIFPWFSQGQPILWWSPDPRMVLQMHNFRLHRSLRKLIQTFSRNLACEIKIDAAFEVVIETCASKPRRGQPGTWILPSMVQAYADLYRAGFAHSVETWINGELHGGLYCVAIGNSVFGESMFAHYPNASKIALAALVAFCRANSITMVDCQQNTGHLASLGAGEIPRADFLAHIEKAGQQSGPDWSFSPLYWKHVLSD